MGGEAGISWFSKLGQVELAIVVDSIEQRTAAGSLLISQS